MKRRPKPLVPTENLAADVDAILQVKFWLTGISPMVWRRVLVPSSFTLRELHGVIRVAMGWEGIHLYDFQLRAARYGSWEVASATSLPPTTPALSPERPAGALRTPTTPRAGLLPAAIMKVQINSGLSLWLDEKWGSGHAVPSLPRHYSGLDANTDGSVPWRRFATVGLAFEAWAFRLASPPKVPAVPRKSLKQDRAASMPDAVWPVSRHRPD